MFELQKTNFNSAGQTFGKLIYYLAHGWHNIAHAIECAPCSTRDMLSSE